MKYLFSLLFFIFIQAEEPALHSFPPPHKGCPLNAWCSEQTGQLITKWENEQEKGISTTVPLLIWSQKEGELKQTVSYSGICKNPLSMAIYFGKSLPTQTHWQTNTINIWHQKKITKSYPALRQEIPIKATPEGLTYLIRFNGHYSIFHLNNKSQVTVLENPPKVMDQMREINCPAHIKDSDKSKVRCYFINGGPQILAMRSPCL